MTNAHYIIFHPDSQRQRVEVRATAISGDRLVAGWRGYVYVDLLDYRNEDPYVFHNPWLYSYCHASQLRRSPNTDNHLAPGSWLVFISGQAAERQILAVDTVFLVGEGQEWSSCPKLALPKKYAWLSKEKGNLLYSRHFFIPLECTDKEGKPVHGSVKFTYEADLWEPGKSEFSFLPLDREGNKVSIPFPKLSGVAEKIKDRVEGKYPVRLESEEMAVVINQLNRHAATKVLKDIELQQPRSRQKGCHGEGHGGHGHRRFQQLC